MSKKLSYMEWIEAVIQRDNKVCRLCGSADKVNAHHIWKQSEYPELQFDVNNGITLCYKCHQKVYKKESSYIDLFERLIGCSSVPDPEARKRINSKLQFTIRFHPDFMEELEKMANQDGGISKAELIRRALNFYKINIISKEQNKKIYLLDPETNEKIYVFF